tara:strand:+ start:223 stop:453 length:231 start_codon:yes stop_codon:yes gene_type:complete
MLKWRVFNFSFRSVVAAPGLKKGKGRLVVLTTGGLNSKLQAATEVLGKAIRIFLIAGNINGDIGARTLMQNSPVTI